MASKERAKFENPVVEWVDSRLPVFTLLNKEYGVFPTPRNFNYFWNFGAIAMVMLITMIITGITLAMHYNPSTAGAFDSVERIMRDVNHGWLIRYLHMNGASFFFIAVFIHIFRGLYYGSYKQPRELLWMLGVVILLLMMATAFMGYVLPWGQMSFWGATVITNLFSAIPLVGDSIVTLLWGGFSVDNPTLNRFFALHYLMPFVIVGVVFLHVWALHVTGSNNPLGIDVSTPQDTLPFHPYYTIKDTMGLLAFLLVYVAFTFFMPNALGHPDNYIPANPLVTPAHIVPEWYFLPFYAILRAITFDLNLYLAVAGAAAGFLVFQYCWLKTPDPRFAPHLKLVMIAAIVFGIPGALLAFFKDVAILSPIVHLIPFGNVSLMPAKLGGVLAMFGSIAMLLLLPFIDRHPVRSARFRPWFRTSVLVLVGVFIVLGICGAKPAEGLWVPLAQIMSLYYFGFFLVLIPLFNHKEPITPLPISIHNPVLNPKILSVALISLALLFAAPQGALAKAGDVPDTMKPGEAVQGKSETGGAPATPTGLDDNAPVETTGDVAATVDEEPADGTASEGKAPAADQSATAGETDAVEAGAPESAQSPAEVHENPAEHGSATGADGHHVPEPPKMDWSFSGPFGTYDRASLQRGFQVYKQVCASCHGMKLLSYRHLEALGYDESQIKAIAAEYTITDGPNDEGEMFERPGRPSDRFKEPYANENAARAANGALPPDLSLITKARAGGADYVHAVLVGYDEAPAGYELTAGQYFNTYFPGNKIMMPPPLIEGAVAYEDGTEGTVEQYATDVSTFLTWAAEPEMEVRKQTGIKVMLFLAIFTFIMYRVKKKIWANAH